MRTTEREVMAAMDTALNRLEEFRGCSRAEVIEQVIKPMQGVFNKGVDEGLEVNKKRFGSKFTALARALAEWV